MRAFAAILVMWAHIKYVASFGPNPFIASVAGSAGVDIFFVISGFIISMSAERAGFEGRAFLVTRLCRIVPFYWLMTAPFILFDALSHRLYWRSLLNSVTFIPLMDFNKFNNPVLSFGWSLSFEFWFYTLFAVLMAMLGARALPFMAPVMAILCGIVWFSYRGTWFTPRFLFHPLTLEFAGGIVLYQLRKLCGVKTIAIVAPLVLVSGLMVLKTQSLGWHEPILASAYLGFKRAWIWGGFSTLLITLTVSVDNLQLISWPRWAVSMGNSSYSIYLIQMYALYTSAGVRMLSNTGPWISVPLFVTFTIVGGHYLSKQVEMPLTRWVRLRAQVKPSAGT